MGREQEWPQLSQDNPQAERTLHFNTATAFWLKKHIYWAPATPYPRVLFPRL